MNYMPQEERPALRPKASKPRAGLVSASTVVTNEPDAVDAEKHHIQPNQQHMPSDSPTDRPLQGKKRYFLFGAVLLVTSLLGMTFLHTGSAVTTGEAAEAAIYTGSSKTLPAGTKLAANDKDMSLEPTDYTIEGKTNDPTTKLYVWDYAGEDGDYVQLIIDGEPASEEFMILNKPREFDVPSSGKVQIKGIHDAGGGLTYAIHCDLNGQSYFNTAPEGVLNTYTIVGSS